MSGDRSSIRLDGDQVVIRLPIARAHGLRVALAPCPCKAHKSTETEAIRDRLAQGLARALAGGRK